MRTLPSSFLFDTRCDLPAVLRGNAVGMGFATVLVSVIVASRWIEHAPNATAAAAASLVAGFVFRSVLAAAIVPLAGMLLSDALLGGYQPGVMLTVYTCLLLPVLAGRLIRRAPGLRTRAAATAISVIVSSVAFFLLTNLAVWAFSGYYPVTLAGLGACYAAAVPFFRFTLAGDAFYTLSLFSALALVVRSLRSWSTTLARTA